MHAMTTSEGPYDIARSPPPQDPTRASEATPPAALDAISLRCPGIGTFYPSFHPGTGGMSQWGEDTAQGQRHATRHLQVPRRRGDCGAAGSRGGATVRKREVLKFLSGFLAGAGVVHTNIGFGIATGMFNRPHYLGHTWSAASLWVGGAVYLVASLVVGYLGWRSPKAMLPLADPGKSSA